MIDPPVAGVARAAPPREPQGQALLPVPAGTGRLLVLSAVFVCAACGLVYELELVALASYLVGDSVTEASVVLSVMVFAMGVGSLLAKRLRWRPTVGFGVVEALLALVGGSSAMVLYGFFAWYGQSRSVLVAFSLAIGVLIGAEVPLLMTLIQRIRKQDAGGAVADLFAADYVGALAGGLAFPFVLLPVLGQLSGALVTGAVNALAGGATVLWLFRRDLTVRARWLLLGVNVLVLGLLATATVCVGPFERAARRAVYGAEVRVAVRTDVQEVVLTGGTGARAAPALYLDGRLRVSGRDGYRHHEALVQPAMAGPHRRVLVLGGGDGLALREVLRRPGVASVTVVEHDPEVVRLARTDPGLSALNEDAFGDRRVRAVTADPFDWLRAAVGGGGSGGGRAEAGSGGVTGSGGVMGSAMPAGFDVVICDLPDPGISASSKLYSQEFYGLLRRVLAPNGRLAVHAGSLSVRPRAFWTVDATLRAAGLRTTPYQVGGRAAGAPRASGAEASGASGAGGRPGAAGGGPGGGEPGRGAAGTNTDRDWGLILASPEQHPPRLRLPTNGPRPRSLTPASLRAAERAAQGERVTGMAASTLMHPRYLD